MKSCLRLCIYAEIERWLGHIPEAESPCYVNKIRQAIFVCDLSRHRFWERLHDTFNEALGAFALRRNFGREEIGSVRPNGCLTPDLIGKRRSLIHYLEVKTINYSQEECDSWHREAPVNHAPSPEFRKELTSLCELLFCG